MIWAESTLMVLPHQFSAREASTSRRVTLGRLPSLSLRSEKRPCSPEAKCVVWPRQSAHWSDVAQPAPDSASPAIANRLSLRMLVISLLRLGKAPGSSPGDVRVRSTTALVTPISVSKKPTGIRVMPSYPMPRDSRALTAFSVPDMREGLSLPTCGRSAALLQNHGTASRGTSLIYRVAPPSRDICSVPTLAQRVRLR